MKCAAAVNVKHVVVDGCDMKEIVLSEQPYCDLVQTFLFGKDSWNS